MEIYTEDENLFLKSHPYKSWEVKSTEAYDWNEVDYDGHGYVLVNGHRYDSENELYKVEREKWNLLKSK